MSNPILNRKDKYPYRWYESNPTLLQTEKDIMVENFPNFELGKLDDGRLYWAGELAPAFTRPNSDLRRAIT